jgi:hypothetical protein
MEPTTLRVAAPEQSTPTADECNTELARRERIISGAEHAFWSKGKALREIRDGGLYQAQYTSFDAYVKLRWDFTVRYAEYQMGAADVMDALDANNCSPLPRTESQCRPLTRLKIDDVPEVWGIVFDRAPKADDGAPKITAKLVKAVVAEWLGEDEEQPQPDALEAALDEIAMTVEHLTATIPDTRYAHERFAKELRRLARQLEHPAEGGCPQCLEPGIVGATATESNTDAT